MNSNNIKLFSAYIVALLIGWLSIITYIPTIIGFVLVLCVFYFASFFMKSHNNWKINIASISVLPTALLIVLIITMYIPETTKHLIFAFYPFFVGFYVSGGNQATLYALISLEIVSFVPIFLNIQYKNTAKIRIISALIVILYIIAFFSLI